MHQNILLCYKLDKEIALKQIAEEEQQKAWTLEHITPAAARQEITAKHDFIIDYWRSFIAATEAKEQAFTEKLHSITDPELKEIAKAYFIEGRSCEEIGRKFYLERTTVYKKLKRFFDT